MKAAFPLRVKAVMIDLDGTLLDTIPDLAVAANLMLEALGRAPLDADLIRTFVGKGVPDLRGGERGDQIVTVQVVIPKKLTDEQEELFEQLSASLGKEVTQQPKGRGFFDRVKDAIGV